MKVKTYQELIVPASVYRLRLPLGNRDSIINRAEIEVSDKSKGQRSDDANVGGGASA